MRMFLENVISSSHTIHPLHFEPDEPFYSLHLSRLLTFLFAIQKKSANDSWRSQGKGTNSKERRRKWRKKKIVPDISFKRKKKIPVYHLLVQLMCIMCTTLSLSIVLRCDFNKFLLSAIAIGAFSSYKTYFAILLIRSRKIEG